ncbi:DUF6499 domain-containing protein [Thiobacillus sp. 65-1402]|mgnify:CR=1 FL=1|uniref:transcriptional regulator domain-containing protein n=1 Tax=Thiobacillus sp. 65-1402 TaxID=1895861 RepID=UPI00095C9555|nr:DUF6499 domain-containing protein [Thiobacillus sp. 65-1402]OJW75737.1 MAG: hypothetical protein BGO62_07260 [Thiobacillus sp. 65-1402]
MDTDAYAYCVDLTRDQWAWEFLRRNPAYRRDYAAFIAIWRALEADYGAPPNRDFSKWKQDPHAYGPLPGDAGLAGSTGELCVVEDDRVLLECWMGAKWGFYKFPLDPERVAPGPDELSWRPPPQSGVEIEAPWRVDLTFDLSLPLPPQLDAAKFRLIGRAAELRRQGLAAPMTVANQRARWTRMLRLLDGKESPNTENWLLLREAQAMADHGYLDILRLADAGAGTK